MKILSIFFMGMCLSVSALAAADGDFSVALMNVESFDWTSASDMHTRVELRAVTTLVTIEPTSADEAKAKTRALMTVLASPEKLLKSTDGKSPSFDSRKMTHDLAWTGLFQLCSSSPYAVEAQMEVATTLGAQSRNRSRFLKLVNSFAPISQFVSERILAFVETVAGEIAKTCDRDLRPLVFYNR